MSVYHPRPDTTYVRRSQQARQSQARGGRWLAAGVGGAVLLVGAYLAAMHFLQGRASVAQASRTVFEARQQQAAPAKPAKTAVQSAADSPAVTRGTERSVREASETSRFQFYEALPHARVEVDAQPLPVKLARPVRIVAGTFTSLARAQQERQRLEKLGFRLEVVPLHRQGRVLYQLRSAPVDNRLEMIRLRNGLQKAGARVLVMRLSPQSQP